MYIHTKHRSTLLENFSLERGVIKINLHSYGISEAPVFGRKVNGRKFFYIGYYFDQLTYFFFIFFQLTDFNSTLLLYKIIIIFLPHGSPSTI